jgi:hypothetical protein
MTTTLTLTKPVEVRGEQAKELEFREPTGGTITDCGFPFDENGLPATKVVTAYISTLGNIPGSSVRALSPTDWFAAMNIVLSFFSDVAMKASPSTPETP